MSNTVRIRHPASTTEAESTDLRVEQTIALIRTLVDTLPAPAKDQFIRDIADKARPMSASRAGEVLNTIVRLLPQQKDWTVAELRRQIDEQGITASPKEIYNAIGYLTRKGRVTRVGYGRYLIEGVGMIATSDDFGGATARHEDEYRTNRDD